MVDHNDLDQGPDDLYDEAAPRSIFAATWFRAVLVLIVLGVIGAVAVPYILDAMNAPPGKLSATATSPPPAPGQPPSAMPPVAATPSTPAPATAPPPPSPTASDKPSEKKDAMISGATSAPEPPKAEPRPTPAAETAAKPRPTTTARSASGQQWFVQVGAFKDPEAAKKVATKLREDKYKVDESARGTAAATVAKATTAPPSDRYDVIVSGQSPTELSQRLAAKGLTAEAAGAGTVVRPSLPLRDAVALSKDLAVDGLKVQVRRAGGNASTSREARASAPAGDGDGLHRVVVGGFADRATALTTLKELEAKGYKPFLTRR